jgi:uncharacterized damage-inducible protein DinB
MTRLRRAAVVSVLAFSLLPPSHASAQAQSGVMEELLSDLGQVEQKVLGLAKAIPESAWGWRPGEGVRSTGEVFQHIAADNYLIPVLAGVPAPPETGITSDLKTGQAYEKKPMSRDALIADVEKSFAFLRKAMTDTGTKLEAEIELFGRKTTTRGLWIVALTHLHEHLGQLIAYARSNKVVPPWSR